MGTKTGCPWGALSPKPAGLLSQVCGCSVPKRTKEGGGSRSPLAGQPERPRGEPPPCPAPQPHNPPPPASRPSARRPPPGKSGAPSRAPPGRRLPWPLAGTRQAAKASSSVHAAAAPRSIPPTALGLAVPSPGGGRASRTAAAPPLASARRDPHLGGLLAAGNWPAQGVPLFYPRQSPPSRRSIKPFRPDRPGTSMRESGGAGPLPPGPPPALCSAGRSGTRTDALTHTRTRTASHSHRCTRCSLAN